jgi:ribonuclease HI/transposase InsO family protein
MRPPARIKDV